MMGGKFGEFSDVWALGVLAYEIWTYGELPYKGMTNTVVLSRVIEGYQLPRPDGCSTAIFNVIASCWTRDYHTRPDCNSLATTLRETVEQLSTHRLTDYLTTELKQRVSEKGCNDIARISPRVPARQASENNRDRRVRPSP